MIDRLQAASRLLIRASLAVFTAVVLLLIQSAFWSTRVSAWMQAIIVATALLSYFRPQYGLLALAALVPLGQVGSRTLDSSMRGAESLVLAFLAGALMRGWTLREFRNFPSTRLEIAALVFGFVVAASCVEQLWLLQIQRDFPWPFAQEVFGYASRNYLTSYNRFTMIFRAMLLLEGLALVVYTARWTQERPQFAKQLLVMIIVGAIGTASLTIGYMATELFATGDVQDNFRAFLTERRWTLHVGDLNAAGSFFAMGACIALGMCLTHHMRRFAWLAAAGMLLLAMALTGSRTAVTAVGVVGLLTLVRISLTHTRPVSRMLIAAAGVLVLGGTLWLTSRTIFGNATPSVALTIRWLFLKTTGDMLTAEPAFGVGIGQYAQWSGYFAPPELMTMLGPNNAHNNFAQIAGELGMVGFAGFIVLLVTSIWSLRNTVTHGTVIRASLLAGLAAFMLTWLGGHPLLVPEVAYPFWIALGLAAASATIASGAVAAGSVLVIAVLLAVSTPFRVPGHVGRIDLSRVSYGVSARQMMASRARFFVPATERRVEFPLRARGASDSDPVEIEVFVDGSASQNITITNRNWQRARIELGGHTSGRFRQIDLLIKPPAVDDIDAPPPVEVGNWEIISKPNG